MLRSMVAGNCSRQPVQSSLQGTADAYNAEAATAVRAMDGCKQRSTADVCLSTVTELLA